MASLEFMKADMMYHKYSLKLLLATCVLIPVSLDMYVLANIQKKNTLTRDVLSRREGRRAVEWQFK